MPIFNEIEMQGTGLLSGSEQEALQIILSHARDSVSPERRQTACAQSESSVHFYQNAGLRFHAITAGPKDGPVVVLLHGFPEFWYGWHRQIEPLVTAGLRVVVPDQRGYNLSSKPVGVAAYALTELVSDVLAIADQLGQDKIFLAGHDWGAAVAWSTALLHPQRIAKLAVLNVPHPAVMRKFLRTHPRQFFRSWYMFFFQLPWLPEALFSALSFRVGARALLHSSRPGTFSVEDLAQYRGAWSQPGALTGMISSLLVFQYGQARIWYAMSRDGLLPKLFSAVHPKYKTPHWSTWIACFAVGIPAGMVDIGDAADLSNIGTLFAFVLVSLGVILLRRKQPDRKRAFRVPFVPWFPLAAVLLCGGLMTGLTVITWLRFVIWLALGLCIYLFYSRRHSEFARGA